MMGKLPWGTLPELSADPLVPRFVYEPFRGWEDGRWFDGPRFVLVEGRVKQYALPGTNGPLPEEADADDPDGFDAWLRKNTVLAWKKSLAQAFRELLPHQSGQLIPIASTASNALVLLGLRLAFPATPFFALERPSTHAPQWKRFCQNLNISTWAAPAQIKNLPAIDIEKLSQAWPEDAAVAFWSELPIPVLPGKLLQEFRMSRLHP